MAHSRIFGLSVVLLLFLASAAWASDSCTSCHDTSEAKFSKNTHARLNTSCTACHGEATKHQEDPSERDFLDLRDPKQFEAINKACLSCHAKHQRMMFWDGSKHQSNDVSCTSCHDIHTQGSQRMNADRCYSCHKDVRRDVGKFSHHPIPEGKIQCSSCHNVHGSLAPSLLSKNTVNELCYTCHTDKRGPFRFAHAPVEENCLNCHTPHGSNSARLMEQNLRTTCTNCHAFQRKTGLNNTAPSPSNTAMTNRGSCLTCHGDIHGSNTDYHFR